MTGLISTITLEESNKISDLSIINFFFFFLLININFSIFGKTTYMAINASSLKKQQHSVKETTQYNGYERLIF